jgi:hypothetical protein
MGELAPELVVTTAGPIRVIELNRPEQRNTASYCGRLLRP